MYEDTTVQATKFHEICAGHRVIGQGGKCERSYHGHNYVFRRTATRCNVINDCYPSKH